MSVKRETIRYIEMLAPGSFYPEDIIQEVTKDEPPADMAAYIFAYRFYSQDRISTTVDGEVFEKWSDEYDVTGYTYPGGVVLSLAQIEAMGKEHEILLFNVRQLSTHAVRCRTHNYQPFYPDRDKIS